MTNLISRLKIKHLVLLSILFIVSCLSCYYCYSFRSFREKAGVLELGKTTQEEAQKIMGCPKGDYGIRSYSVPKMLLLLMIDPPDKEFKIELWSDNDCLVAVAFRGGVVTDVTIIEPDPIFFDNRPAHDRYVACR